MNGTGRVALRWGEARVEIHTPASRLSTALALMFGPFVTRHELPDESDPDNWTATLDGSVFRSPSLDHALFALEEVIAKKLFHESGHLLIHAGAVAKGRRTVLILGPSGSGKTTTTLEFVRRGYRYMADEYTAIDASGTSVHPFPRSFVIKDSVLPLPPGEHLDLECRRTLFLPADSAGLEPQGIDQLWLVFPTYRAESAPAVRGLATAELCMQLLHNTFAFESRENELWPAVSSLAVQARGCNLQHQDIRCDLDLALGFLEDAQDRPTRDSHR